MKMGESCRHHKAYRVSGFACLLLLLLFFVMDIYEALEPAEKAGFPELGFSEDNQTPPATARKLLQSITDADDEEDGSVNRVGAACSKDNILVFQGQTTPLPNGIPTYTAEVQNVCVGSGGCSISNIHLSCGWFSSARLINPGIFRRLAFDDCLVKDGQPLDPGQSISFQYANTFAYPLSVSSIACN